MDLKKIRKKGFTLVEVIVVIAILGILAAIAIPRLGGFTALARSSAASANGQIAKNAALLWLAENGNPSTAVKWDGSGGQEWEAFLGSWPSGVESVEIGTDGSIIVTLEELTLPTETTTEPTSAGPTETDPEEEPDINAVMQAHNTLPVDTSNVENQRIFVPDHIDGIEYNLINAVVSNGNATIEISQDGKSAVVYRDTSADTTGTITLQATQNGTIITKTFNVNIPSGGYVTVN